MNTGVNSSEESPYESPLELFDASALLPFREFFADGFVEIRRLCRSDLRDTSLHFGQDVGRNIFFT